MSESWFGARSEEAEGALSPCFDAVLYIVLPFGRWSEDAGRWRWWLYLGRGRSGRSRKKSTQKSLCTIRTLRVASCSTQGSLLIPMFNDCSGVEEQRCAD